MIRTLYDYDWRYVPLGDMPLETLVEVRWNGVKGIALAQCIALNPENRSCGDEPGFYSQWTDEAGLPIERPFQWQWRAHQQPQSP